MRRATVIVAFIMIVSCQTDKGLKASEEREPLSSQSTRTSTKPTKGPNAPYVPTQMDYLVNTLNAIYATTPESIGWRIFVRDGRDIFPNSIRIQILNLQDSHLDREVIDDQVEVILRTAWRIADEKGWGWINFWLESRIEGEDRVARVCLKDSFIARQNPEKPPAILWVQEATSPKYVPISPPGSKSCNSSDKPR